MCAICGVVNFAGMPVSDDAVVRMRDEMRNRGPDSAGKYINGHVGLGHRRLRIIDLSAAGDQPMTNEDRSIWVVFNGEIYNFQELRRQLQEDGHRFASNSDTEVIIHGYEQWGDGVVEKLDGMFAFAVWDSSSNKLLLARDRFGKKPLCYLRQGAYVAFASEVKALATLPGVTLTVNSDAIDCYLHHLGVTQHHSIYREVHKVQAGHYEIFTTDGHSTVRYYAPDYTKKISLSEPELLECIDGTLRAAVKKRLISDVPLGAFLSGGVDSSLVVALMAGLSDRPVKTFSIGFEERDFSELKYARSVAQRYGTDHEEICLRPEVLRILPSLVWEYSEPFADSSAVPTYYVSQAARRFVTVALSGDGGDELFGGYETARAAYWSRQYDRFVGGPLRRSLESWLFHSALVERSGSLHKLKTLASGAHADPAVRCADSMAFSAPERAALYTDSFRDSLHGSPALEAYTHFWPHLAGLDLVDQNLVLTLHTRLPNDYLVKVDVASMKVGLELRSPFLDADLATLSASIDPLVKVRLGRQKFLLKKLAERYLPAEVIYRRKRGFQLPLTHWLRGDLRPTLDRFLPAGQLVRIGWFRANYIKRLISEHVSAAADHTHRLWALLWLELWYRMFIDRSLSPADDLRS
jgi:asparagine synthase (glutamine-hydrolysing)